MPGGTELTAAEVQPQKEPEVLESPEKVTEVRESAEELQKVDDATLAPETVVEQGDYTVSENLQTAITEAVTTVTEVAVRPGEDLATPDPITGSESAPATSEVLEAAVPTITLEGAGVAGKVTIESAADAAADGGPKTGDREVGTADIAADEGRRTEGAANTAADRGPETEDRVEAAADETVMIDTVPLPETPIATTEIDGREAIGTWPTPEVPNTAGEEVIPPAGSNQVVRPSDSTIGGVSGVAGVSPSSDFSADMEGVQPGESRGFAESDGKPDYTFKGDGISSSTEFTNRFTGGEMAREVTQDTVSASPPLEDETGNQSSSSVNTINGVTISEASVEVEPHNIPDSSEQTSDPSETAEEYSEQLAQYEKELELQQEDLVDLINSLRAELEEINELGEELADKRANMPEPPSQEDYLSEDGSLDEENYSWALKQYSEDKHAFENEIGILLQQIAIKQDIITNLEGQITDKRAEIDMTQKKINKLLGIISNLQKKTNETQDSLIQNIK